MKRVFLQDYKSLDFKFYQNIDDFIVVEEPIRFTNKGNFIIFMFFYVKTSHIVTVSYIG